MPPTTQIFPYLYEITTVNMDYENYTKSTESACALTKNMEFFFSSSSASRKASSSASSVNYVTVSDTDVSVPARKKTKLSTKFTRTR